MGRDNSPKIRQGRKLERKQGNRENHDRILIVSEGRKTEPLYFQDIRAFYRLHSANVQVYYSKLGTAPIQVVKYAQQLFTKGDMHIGIRPKSFEQVYAVFDRDDHCSYFDALRLAKSLDGKIKNDNKQSVVFKSISSVPCFELWLLLHYEDVSAPLTRYEVMARLKKYFPEYEKSKSGVFQITCQYLPLAIERANRLIDLSKTHHDTVSQHPRTEINILVNVLKKLHL